MPVDEHRRAAGGEPFGFAVLTVSDTRDAGSDRSGPRLADAVTAAGHAVRQRRIVRDDMHEIRDAVREALAVPEIDVVLLTGGTGVAPRDMTVDAVRPLLSRELPGFGELFRALSFAEIGAAAMLTRALAGVVGGKAVFALPGSPAALDLATGRLILPEIRHLLAQARRS